LVLVGGAFASGGANAINHYLDRDIDKLMRRTTNRPVASGRVSARNALAFGIILNALAFGLLVWGANPIAAGLTLGATLFYVFVYTLGLKRRTPHNIVIGGAAGAFPPVIGWAAVTGSLELPALFLFAIVFFWTPPHFWALSLLIKDDYARARVPMLPLVVTLSETKRQIFVYTLLLVALTTMFFATGAVGWIYLASAVGLGLVFIAFAWRLMRAPDDRHAASTYKYSLLYLALLFVAIAVDGAVGI
ncbi:MAG: heme o synthase, partial [Chloroflexi bacterium]|nr:heme o synthase [Chloroflexota bacterium]